MTAREDPGAFSDFEKEEILDAVRKVYAILSDLPGPRHAANVLAMVHAELMIRGCGTRSEDDARKMLAEVVEGTLLNFRKKVEHIGAGHG